jgi:hypothetical protein
MVLAAQEVGTHIYVEKPLAATPAEVDRMVAACEAKRQAGRSRMSVAGASADPAIPLINGGKIGAHGRR